MKYRLLYILALLFATLQTFAQSIVSYEYDANNRLTKVTYNSGAVVTYTYDELGNRLSKKVVGSAPNPNIHFYDQAVKAICVENWDTNGDGELSYDEAAAVTDLGGAFTNNDGILSFNELQYFTGLTTIGENAFNGCLSLASVMIPDGVTTIGDNAFFNCYAFKTITLPDGLKSIGAEVFCYCYNIVKIELPNGLESIGDGAFQNCSFTSLYIPSSVSSIGGYLLGSCNYLTSITVDPANETYDSRNNCNAIIETATNTLVAGCKNTVMPDDLKAIGDGAFYGNSLHVSTLTIPESVTSIGDRAFIYNSQIQNIVFPANLEYVGWDAFYNTGWFKKQPDGMVYINQIAYKYKGTMSQNSSVEFDEGTKMISPYFFDYAAGRNVTSISIPKSVKYIGHNAFDQCDYMTSVTVYAKTPPALDSHYHIFPYSYSLNKMTLYVPYGTKAKYENANEWKRFKNIVEMEQQSYIEGDANGDGKVTVTDIAVVVNQILQLPNTDYSSYGADANGDGSVTVTDIGVIVDIILGNGANARKGDVLEPQ